MKSVRYRLASVAALLALLPMGGIGYRLYASAPRVVDITAKRFGFTPDQVTLKKGETVTLRLHSEDVTHGFFMRQLKIDAEVEPGKTTDVTITPDKPGSYTTICDHFCGANHGNMKMTIVVE